MVHVCVRSWKVLMHAVSLLRVRHARVRLADEKLQRKQMVAVDPLLYLILHSSRT